jgi:hypothetical protein
VSWDRSTRGGRSARLIALVGLIVAFGACGGASVPSALSPATASGAPSFPPTAAPATMVVAPSQGAGASGSAPASAGPPASAVAASGAAAESVAIDQTLLEVLPTTISGLPVAAIAKPAGTDDPLLAETVERMAQAFVIDPATNDFAYTSVMALRPGVFGASSFRSWRDSFDEGACSQSGGVTGHAETTIAGRTVYIGTCDGGVSTYHVRLDPANEIVSISAFGEQRLGEQLLAALRP